MMGAIRPAMVITRADRIGKPKSVQPGNMEWATAIVCISGDGYAMPPYLVLQGRHHLANWYTQTGLPHDWVIRTTTNGWTDNKTGLKWLEHFDNWSKSRTKGVYRMLILDGHESHVNAEFEAYCKEHNIITLCLPPQSSHLTHPLDVGCFNVLKLRYGDQLNVFIKGHVNHITKVEFLQAFKQAFLATMTPENIRGSFRGAGTIPLDPDAIVTQLDIRLSTPSPPQTPSELPAPWTSQTPHNPTEVVSQSDFIKSRIATHQDSSPSSLYKAVDQLFKAAQAIAHRVTLMDAEVHTLREANMALSKRRRAKRTRIQDGGDMSVLDAQNVLAEKGVIDEESGEEGNNGGPSKRRRTGARQCGICRKTGHNARTCPEAEEMDSNSYSE